mgnify:CR=1 FL=1
MARWKPSRTAARKFAQEMDEIADFCKANGIRYSTNMDSYYFRVGNVDYRVSNHTVEASNAAAFDCAGEQVRESYHPEGRDAGTVYIHAGKTRIKQIYNDLIAGYSLDGRGNRK